MYWSNKIFLFQLDRDTGKEQYDTCETKTFPYQLRKFQQILISGCKNLSEMKRRMSA